MLILVINLNNRDYLYILDMSKLPITKPLSISSYSYKLHGYQINLETK